MSRKLPGLVLSLLFCTLPTAPLLAQEAGATAQPPNTPNAPATPALQVGDIQVDGLVRIPETLVRNQIRHLPGTAYSADTVEADIARMTMLGKFERVVASLTPRADGKVDLHYQLKELPLMETIEVTGNKAIETEDLRARILLRPGDPADRFLLDEARRKIIDFYAEKGAHDVQVDIDPGKLAEGHVVFKIVEGFRTRLRDVRIEGNTSFPDELFLNAQNNLIRSKTYSWIMSAGWLDRSQLELDAAAMRNYYRDRGWLDAQVSKRLDFSADQRSAVAVFEVIEGSRYVIRDIHISYLDGRGRPIPMPSHTFTADQLMATLSLKKGDFYEKSGADASEKAIESLFGKIGHLDTQVRIDRVYHADKGAVTLEVAICEGRPTQGGKLEIVGNENTQNRVVLRDLDGMRPGRLFDNTKFEDSKRRLAQSPYFSSADVTLLGAETDETRDVVVQVHEKSTGSISFGVGVSSDSGVGATIDYTQRNFDILDWPGSWDELASNKGWRGAGQTFNINLSPGDQNSNYSVSWTEPQLLDSDYYLSLAGTLSQRQLTDWDEDRTNSKVSVGRRFGRQWSVGTSLAYEELDINSIRPQAPTEVIPWRGNTVANTVGLNVSRSTIDSILEPGHGMKDSLSVERYGLLGGDLEFTKLLFSHQQFWTVEEDFLGRRTTVNLRSQFGYIPEGDAAPFFDQFYAGGHRSLRGFDFRGVGPMGIRSDNGQFSERSVGGTWMTTMTLEYSRPIYEDVLRWVVFTDQGTLLDEVGFSNWRVSVGTGLRIKIPFLGQAPLAIDFAIPLHKEPTDNKQIFSFDFSMPIQ